MSRVQFLPKIKGCCGFFFSTTFGNIENVDLLFMLEIEFFELFKKDKNPKVPSYQP